MKYFSLRDVQKRKPFDFEPETVQLPLFLSFYAWWNELSIPKLSTLATDVAKAKSTEELYELFYKAKKEYPLFKKPQSFFPNWPIFSSLNALFSDIVSEYFKTIQVNIDLAIRVTGPKKLEVFYPENVLVATKRCYRVAKIANPKYTQVAICVDLHAKEVKSQPKLDRPKDAYKRASEKVKKSQTSLQRVRDHREFVVHTKAPKGKPNFFDSHVYYDPPTHDQVRDFDSHLNKIDADISAEESRYKQLSKTLKKKFFDNEQPVEERTKQVVQLLINKTI